MSEDPVTVLLVEDDEEDALLIRKMLAKAKGGDLSPAAR